MSVSATSPASDPAVQSLADLLSAAARLEAGQGHTPLLDAARALDTGQRPPAQIVVVADTPAQTSAVVAWLAGAGAEGGARLVTRELDTGGTAARALHAELVETPSLLLLAAGDTRPGAAPGDLGLLTEAAMVWAAVDLGGGLPSHLAALPGAALPPFRLASGENATPIGSPDADAAWSALRSAFQARRAMALAELVQERHQAEVRQLIGRQKREQGQDGPSESVASDAETRQRVEGMKAVVASELSLLAQDLRERGRRAGLRKGEIFGLIDQLLENLKADDLEQEVAGKKIRLTLRGEVTDELKTALGEALKGVIADDCEQLARRLTTVEEKLAPRIESLGLIERRIRLAAPSVEQFWAPIEEGLHLQGRYRGEIPKRGFLQRLGEGRRVVFLVLMIGSLFGGFMGFNIRRAAAMGPIFLVLFLGVFLYTYISWRKNERVVFDDELIRLRDILSSEFARLIGDALRERHMRLLAAADEMRKELFASLDALHREANAARAAALEGERKLARSRQRVVDQRLRDLQALAPALAKARQTFERQATDRRADALRAFAARQAS